MKNKYIKFSLLLAGSVLLAGCNSTSNKNSLDVSSVNKGENSLKEKVQKEENKNSNDFNSPSIQKVDTRTENNPPISDKKILDKLLLKSENNVLETGESELKHILPIKPQIQEVWYYCVPTTVSMMLSSKGIYVNQYILAKEMGTYEPFGTHNKDGIRILNKHMFGYEYPSVGQNGYRLETVTNVDQELPRFKERLIQNIKDGYPMYYTFDVSKIYPGKKGEHNVIGIGYKLTEDKSDIEYLYYLDPSPNVQDSVYGGLKIITPRKLLEATLSCEEPNYAW